MKNERDLIILSDGCFRGASLAFGIMSLILLLANIIYIGLCALIMAIICIAMSWIIALVFKDHNLPR